MVTPTLPCAHIEYTPQSGIAFRGEESSRRALSLFPQYAPNPLAAARLKLPFVRQFLPFPHPSPVCGYGSYWSGPKPSPSPHAWGGSVRPSYDLARIIHETSVNNPGLHANGLSRGGMTPGGRRTRCRSRGPRDGRGFKMPMRGLIRPGAPTTRASVKLALFASRVRE